MIQRLFTRLTTGSVARQPHREPPANKLGAPAAGRPGSRHPSLRRQQYLYLIFLILVLAGFFRFFKLREWFYWSIDEELVATFARRLFVEGRPFLSIPVGTLGVNLGPFFYYLTAIILYLGKFNPVATAFWGPSLGVLTCWLAYFLMSKVFSRRVGFLAAFLYGGSFLMSLFDRRWWPLSLDPLLFFLGFFALFMLARRKYKYFTLLGLVLAMAFNSDPTVLVFWVASGLIFSIWRLPVFRKEYILGGLIVLGGLLPIFLTEVKHGFEGLKAVLSGQLFSKVIERTPLAVDLRLFLATPGKLIYTPARGFLERQFYYGDEFFVYDWGVLLVMGTVVASLVVGGYLAFGKKGREALGLRILYVLFLSFCLGILVFVGSGHNFYQHYFLIILPGFFVLWAVLLEIIWRKSKVITGFLLFLFLAANLRTLVLARSDYGHERKIEAVEWVVENLKDDDFGLYTSEDGWMLGGGWTYLFFYKGKMPKFSYGEYYLNQLFGREVKEKQAGEIVLMIEKGYWQRREDLSEEIEKRLIKKGDFGSFEAVIFDNRDGWVERERVKF